MSDDQSFYEIQLNTPHLVLAFLGAAVVGVAFFWLGVVIGRGQTGVAGSPEWQAALPADAGDSGEEDDTMSFYDQVNEPVTRGAPAGDAGAATVDEPPTETATIPPAEPESASGNVGPAEPQAAPTSTTRAPAGLPRENPSLVSGWIIQVRSTPEEAAANALQASLTADGYPAFVVSAEVNGQTYYRVRVGRYGSRADAQQVEAALLTRGDVENAWVTEG